MKKAETELFKNLCSFKSTKINKDLLKSATPAVLGELFFNRMQGVAYGVLKNHGLSESVNREFRNSLKGGYEQNIRKNRSFFSCVQYVENILSNDVGRYIMLKGAYLCKSYPEGYRTSNDIDLLVRPSDVTRIGKVLNDNGFVQGNVRGGKFVKATRREIIESKMTRGETVPYIKEINIPDMKFLEVDINFSIDYKPGETDILEEFFKQSGKKAVKNLYIHTLSDEDFILHLCCHLYKEATTLPWIEMSRDMTLYKYCDIYMLLADKSSSEIGEIFKRAAILKLEKILAFSIISLYELFIFDNDYAVSAAKKVLEDDKEFVNTVFSPKDKKTLIYTEKDISKRFFEYNRIRLLERSDKDEKAENASE